MPASKKLVPDDQVAKRRRTDGNITGNVKADPNTDIRNNVTLPSGSRLLTGGPLRISKYRCRCRCRTDTGIQTLAFYILFILTGCFLPQQI
jgi:hypothetical protein